MRAEIPANAVPLFLAFVQHPSNVAWIVQHVTSAILQMKPQRGAERRPGLAMIIFAVALFAAAPMISNHTPVLQVDLQARSVVPLPLGTDNKIVTHTPFYGIPVEWSTNTTFKEFYDTIYIGAHESHDDVVAHTVLFFATLFIVAVDQRLLVPWCLHLAVCMIVTRPLMLLSVEHGWLESTVGWLVGVFFAARYRVLSLYLTVFTLWVYLDAASHWYYGHNFDYAYWTGKYALGWGLYGQALLAVGHAQEFITSLL